MVLTDPHYLERTSRESIESRIVQFSDNNLFGFKVDLFISDRGKITNFDKVAKDLDTDADTINFYISETLSYLTQNDKLALWKPNNKLNFQTLDVGRICFDLYGDKFYPIIQGGNGKGGFYNGGDNIWIIAENNTLAKTFKFYESNNIGRDLVYASTKVIAREVKKIEGDEFKKTQAYGYPYGRNFVVKIDLKNEDPDSVINIMQNQINRACK